MTDEIVEPREDLQLGKEEAFRMHNTDQISVKFKTMCKY